MTRSEAETRLVPYITSRKGEKPGRLADLKVVRGFDRKSGLGYQNERPEDRDVRGALWGRCSEKIGPLGMPVGEPQWRMVHPRRQRRVMERLLCQVCTRSAKTPDGYIFLAGPDENLDHKLVAQPPVCLGHVRASAEQCGHLKGRPKVFLVRSAPLYGVLGIRYQISRHGFKALPATKEPLPYGHAGQPWFLASQMVRSLNDATLLRINDLPPAA
ncbi:hypothetical protein [Streptomyces sp. NPDC001815]|uniref:hypothetical protein n=1 Tax=Streptomyces sp. NPDC001815 TaxID=3154526 RepID=UPI0033232151